MSAKSIYTKEILFLGEQITVINKIVQVFRDGEGESYHFTGIRGIYFGESYLVSEEGRIKCAFPERPEIQTLHPTAQESMNYEAQKICVREARAQKRKEMKIKKLHPDIVQAIKLLRPFARGLDHWDQTRFFSYLKNECSKKGKK